MATVDLARMKHLVGLLALMGIMGMPAACAELSAKDDDLAFLEEVTGSDLCSSGGVLDGNESLELASVSKLSSGENSFTTSVDYARYRSIVVAKFDTEKYRCLSFESQSMPIAFRDFRSPHIALNSGHVSVDGRRVPVIVSRARGFEYRDVVNRRTIYVHVPGGPGQADIISPSRSLLDYFEGTLVVDFFYTGNGFNTVHPEPAFDIAVNQLASFLRKLRSLNPDAKIVLIGESLGAVISVAAVNMDESREIALDNLVLLSPPFANLDEVGQNLETLAEAENIKDRSVRYRVRNSGSNYNAEGKEMSLDWSDVFKQFYAEQGQIRLAQRMRSMAASQRALIIYGSADIRIGPELAAEFSENPMPNVQLIRIEEMGHQFSSMSEHSKMRDAIADFVDTTP